jgi:hypothetical protein
MQARVTGVAVAVSASTARGRSTLHSKWPSLQQHVHRNVRAVSRATIRARAL